MDYLTEKARLQSQLDKIKKSKSDKEEVIRQRQEISSMKKQVKREEFSQSGFGGFMNQVGRGASNLANRAGKASSNFGNNYKKAKSNKRVKQAGSFFASPSLNFGAINEFNSRKRGKRSSPFMW